MDSIVLRKKSLPEGTVRDYGSYGKYQKQEGKWKRLKKGYPTFRRTLSFKLMKSFLLCQKSFEEDQFETLNGPALRAILKKEGWTRQFNRWVKEQSDGQKTL